MNYWNTPSVFDNSKECPFLGSSRQVVFTKYKAIQIFLDCLQLISRTPMLADRMLQFCWSIMGLLHVKDLK